MIDGIIKDANTFHVYVKSEDGTEDCGEFHYIHSAKKHYKRAQKLINGAEREPKVYQWRLSTTYELVEIYA